MRWLRKRRESPKREKLAAIDDLLRLLGGSDDSGFAVATVGEITAHVVSARNKLAIGDATGNKEIRGLLAPTGALQDTAIDNGWGDQFIDLANRLC